MKICIIGAGTWGVALAKILAAGHEVNVWSVVESELDELEKTNVHKNLPEVVLPEEIKYERDLSKAVAGAKIVIIAVPSVYVRSTMNMVKEYVKAGQIIACVAKGMEADTLFTMSEIIDDVLGGNNPVVALSGPTHAEEVSRNIPTLIVSASSDADAAKMVQTAFAGTCLRPYTNSDVKGVELSGALKNIIALACGIADGLGYGDNTKAAIMTRGLAEITDLGVAMGCLKETFSGLSGIGDMIVTSTSRHSRNNRAGRYIGQGMKPADAVKEVGMVVEGIYALPAAMKLSEKYNEDMPIISAVNDIVTNEMNPRDVVAKLWSRAVKPELRLEKELLNTKK